MPSPIPLFGRVEPIDVWVSLRGRDGDSDDRGWSLRFKTPLMKRSMTFDVRCDVYCPEASILRAAAAVIEQIERLQAAPSRKEVAHLLGEAIVHYVEPF